MWQAIRSHPRAVLGAILAHLVFLAILIISFRFSETPTGMFGEPPEVIEVVAVDEKVIQAELDRLKATEQRKIDEARKAREAKLQEQRRKEDLKKQKAAAAKKLKQQKAAEKKRLAELEAKRKQEAEQNRKEQLRKEEERTKAIQAEIARQEAAQQKQLEADRQARQAESRRQASLSEINKYRSLIKEEVTRHWNIPATAHDDLICEVKVRLIPSGDVVDVKIIKSSGDAAFDRSVEKAVYRAAPLRVPSVESGLFDEFREVVFQFEPRNRV